MFDRAFNALMCNNLMTKKRLGKLVDQEDKYTRSVKNCHLEILIVGIKVSIAKCQPEI